MQPFGSGRLLARSWLAMSCAIDRWHAKQMGASTSLGVAHSARGAEHTPHVARTSSTARTGVRVTIRCAALTRISAGATRPQS